MPSEGSVWPRPYHAWHSERSRSWHRSNPPPDINTSICRRPEYRSRRSATKYSFSGVRNGRGGSVRGRSADPTPDGDMIHAEVPLSHNLLYVKAERIPQVPTDAQNDDLGFEMAPLEQFRPVSSHAGQRLSDRLLAVCNTSLSGEFHPIVAYLFTDFKCNLSCHYCGHQNDAPGMSEDTAVRSIEWLHETGGRVLALMGGEVLLVPTWSIRSWTMRCRRASGFTFQPMAASCGLM